MKSIAKLFLIGTVLVTSAAFGQQVAPNCEVQSAGTVRTKSHVSFINTTDSAKARTLADFRNAAVNYYIHDNAGYWLNFIGGSGKFHLPICNEVGQCVQSTAEIRFTYNGGVPVIGIDIGFGIEGYNITVEDAGGNKLTYEAGKDQQSQRVLSVPASGPEGLQYQDQTCRNNDHTAQQQSEGDGESATSGTSGGGGSFDEFAGEYPIGGSSWASGGGINGGNCWKFVARDGEGKFISSYVICF